MTENINCTSSRRHVISSFFFSYYIHSFLDILCIIITRDDQHISFDIGRYIIIIINRDKKKPPADRIHSVTGLRKNSDPEDMNTRASWKTLYHKVASFSIYYNIIIIRTCMYV